MRLTQKNRKGINKTRKQRKQRKQRGQREQKKQRGQREQKKQRRQSFLFNPNDPKRSFDVYIDKNPNDTIPIKYKSVNDVKDTIIKLEKLYKAKKYPHKRIWQVGMIMKVRLNVLKDKKPHEYALAKRYFKFLGVRTDLPENERYLVTFHPD